MTHYECIKCKAKFLATTEEDLRSSMVPGDRKFEWVFICQDCRRPPNPHKEFEDFVSDLKNHLDTARPNE